MLLPQSRNFNIRNHQTITSYMSPKRSVRTNRAQSAEPRFMTPTIASNARARRATSAEPTVPTNPASARATRANSPTSSSKASNYTSTSPKPIKRTAKAPTKLQALSTRLGLTLSKIPSSSKPVPAKPSQKVLNDTTAAPAFEGNRKLQRTGYGDARAAREDQIGAAMATTARAKGLIDDETAKFWGTPWHQKGHMELNWTQKIIDKHNAENGIVPETVMSLKEAEAIKKKKDQDLEDWAKAYMTGQIDENGNRITPGTKKPVFKSQLQEQDERRAARKMEAKKEPLNKVQEGRIAKKTATKQTSDLPTIADASSYADFLGQKPAATPAVKKAARKITRKPASATTDNHPHAMETQYDAPISPLPGRPSYAQYKYQDLNALCRDRNIKSGGGEQALRYRLIRDDTLVLNGESHLRDAKNYSCRKEHDHVAPVVANAPIADRAQHQQQKKKTAKRARDDNEDDERPKPKGKKVRTS
ncbi:hypothetical protein DPSP01_000886 [Paraphaeosphaeria sporulosa]|uniref:Uncharacterized protein n=1 Tax=Paraphaeosphaeria sporulosa TaxID=1460663 RepID=A0A177CRI1_9PLEO|nr:uncharacterized protein CC84DRAFT_436019 [Paraphaeosphaeria sporulosa]OAG09387.1 hypothetical protein CC84DRAFT_436019 [Paraphaeosphaeria sporulosa]